METPKWKQVVHIFVKALPWKTSPGTDAALARRDQPREERGAGSGRPVSESEKASASAKETGELEIFDHQFSGVGIDVPMKKITQLLGIISPTDISIWCETNPQKGTFANPWLWLMWVNNDEPSGKELCVKNHLGLSLEKKPSIPVGKTNYWTIPSVNHSQLGSLWHCFTHTGSSMTTGIYRDSMTYLGTVS